jgi:hypothetical protein
MKCKNCQDMVLWEGDGVALSKLEQGKVDQDVELFVFMILINIKFVDSKLLLLQGFDFDYFLSKYDWYDWYDS